MSGAAGGLSKHAPSPSTATAVAASSTSSSSVLTMTSEEVALAELNPVQSSSVGEIAKTREHGENPHTPSLPHCIVDHPQ